MLAFLDKPFVRLPVYAGFGLLVFIIAVAATFPDDQIKDIVSVEIEKQLGGKYTVDIADLDVWWITGVSLESVTIEERVDPAELEEQLAKAEETGLPSTGPMKVSIPRVSGRLSLIRSILGGPTVEFEIELSGGTIDGHFQQGSEQRKIYVDLGNLDLRKTTELSAFLGVPMFGELTGTVDLVMHPSKPMVTGGTVELHGEKLTVGPATIETDKFPPITYLDIPQTNFGTLDIELAVEGASDADGGDGDEEEPGKPPARRKTDSMNIDTFEWSGRDVRGQMWGEFGLASRLEQTQADVEMRMQLDENFVKKNNLGPLLNVAEVRKGKNKDWFGFRLYGRLKNIRFKGSPQSAAGPEAAANAEPADDEE